MYQNFNNLTNPEMSIKTFLRESGKKKQRTTGVKITRRYAIISK